MSNIVWEEKVLSLILTKLISSSHTGIRTVLKKLLIPSGDQSPAIHREDCAGRKSALDEEPHRARDLARIPEPLEPTPSRTTA